MQLTAPRRLRDSLTVATCSLLSLDAAHADFFDAKSLRNVDSAVLVYTEQDRVTVIEPVVQFKKELGDGEFLTVKFVYDAMSGATPNGATPTNTVQTFSGPSGQNSYTTAAHKLPLVSFEDTRVAVSLDWELPMSRGLRGQYNVNFSRETDYTSLGASASFLWDVNNELTTLTAGIAANLDQVSPTGGVPVGLSALSTTVAPENDRRVEREEAEGSEGGGDGGSKTKTGYDLLVGVTQVLTRRTLMQLNYSYGKSSGYLTDPYKIVSVINGTTGETLPVNSGGYLHEKRPDTRTRNALYWKTVYHLPEDVVHVSYRYYWDNWGIQSNTVDLTYRLQLGAHDSLEPHYRYYTQTAADFFTNSIVDGNTPNYASADLRLAALHSNTVGLRYAHALDSSSELGLGVDYMHQTGDAHPASAIGVQKNEALFTDLKTMSVTADFSMKF